METAKEFQEKMTKKILEVLSQADRPMMADEICTELVSQGHSTSTEFNQTTLSLPLLVKNYLSSVDPHFQVSFEFYNGFIYLPQKTFTQLKDCQQHITNLPEYLPAGYMLHLEEIERLLTLPQDILDWANLNRTNSDAKVRYYAFLYLINEINPSSIVKEMLLDSSFRINSLAVLNISKARNAEIAKIVSMLRDDKYTGLIASRVFSHDKLLKAYSDLIISGTDDQMVMGIEGIMNDKRFKSVPVLLSALATVGLDKWLSLFEEEFEARIKNYVERTSSTLGKLSDSERNQIMDSCDSSNQLIQNLAFKAMDKRWLKVDLDKLEQINTDENAFATELKLETLYKKNSPNRASISKSYLASTQISIRHTALKILGERGSETELKMLMEIFKSEKERDRFDLPMLLKAIKKLQSS